MARIQDVRSAVIAGATRFRPDMDFQVPNKLVDHIVFTTAAEVLRNGAKEKGVTPKLEPWMITRFECKAATLHEPACLSDLCESQYYIDLTFEPLSLDFDAGIAAYLQNSMTGITYIPSGLLPRIKYMEFGPSERRPSFTRVGDRLYFFGGSRKFSEANILLDAAVSGLKSETGYDNCKGDVIVPISNDLIPTVEDLATKRILERIDGGIQDLVDDGTKQELNVG